MSTALLVLAEQKHLQPSTAMLSTQLLFNSAVQFSSQDVINGCA